MPANAVRLNTLQDTSGSSSFDPSGRFVEGFGGSGGVDSYPICGCCGRYHAVIEDGTSPFGFLNGDDRGGTGSGGKPSLTVTGAGTQLTRSNVSWGTSIGQPATVDFSFRSTAPTTMPSDTSGFSRFSATQISVTLLALQSWSDVANITFNRVDDGDGYSNNATMVFGNYSSGSDGAAAFAYLPNNRATTSNSGDVWINSSLSYNATPVALGYGFQVLTHEIGHAIGLSHPSAYNAGPGQSITYSANASYYEDSRQYSIMSYFSETNTGGSFGGRYSAVPLLDDIAAAQRLYGANMTTRTGDTVYGFNSNAGRSWFEATASTTALIFAVWDAGGQDTFDFSGYTQNQIIDLRQGAFSNVGGLVGNIAIAAGAVIEAAIGGSGNDTIFGNAADNTLTGNAGNDTIDGGLGVDTVVYSGNRSAYTVTWNGRVGTVTGPDGTDTLTNVEFLRFADQTIAAAPTGGLIVSGDLTNNVMTGTDFADTLNGGGGDDTLNGGGGDDSLNGGIGNDTVNGGLGNDVIAGGLGNDTLSGGDGYDVADYSGSAGGVTASLLAGTASGGAGSDTLSGFEELRGSASADTLSGDNLNNTILGGGGSDILNGLGGDDVLTAGAAVTGGGAPDVVKAQGTANASRAAAVSLDNAFDLVPRDGVVDATTIPHATVTATTHGGVEYYAFTAAAGAAITLDIDNASFDSVIRVYDSAGNLLATNDDGAVGADSGPSTDSALTYTVPANGVYYVEVSRWLNGSDSTLTTDAPPAGQTYTLNVSVAGHAVVAAVLTGSTLNGGDGNDTLNGSAGVDTLNGDAGNDTVNGAGGDDVIDGGQGLDTAVFSGNRASYTITTQNGVTTVSGADGVDRVTNVERLQFADQTVTIGGQTLTGTANAETLNGSDGDDTLNGLGGSDTLNGFGGNDILIGGAGDDTLVGGTGNDIYEVTEAGDVVVEQAGEGNDTVFSHLDTYALAANVEVLALTGSARVGIGNALDNTLIGTAGGNILIGGAGADRMIGGQGSDVYEVTDAGDVVVENVNEGTDTVFSYLDSYVLGTNVERLELVGRARTGSTSAEGGTIVGNGLDNTLIVGGGSATLTGGGGHDTAVIGGARSGFTIATNGGITTVSGGGRTITLSSVERIQFSDQTVVLAAGASLTGTSGAERLDGTDGYDTLSGGAGADVLAGYGGNDTLIGGTGADILVGGDGDDVYEIDESGDQILESEGEGTDTVFSYLDGFTLSANAEVLALVGGARTGSGNGLANTLIGNDLNNVLAGGGGADVLIGGRGDDVYEVDQLGDVVRESAGEGTDTVFSYADGYTLGANVETLVLAGSARSGYGNAAANTLIGNNLNNVLVGGAGADTLIGGGGDDVYEVTEAGDIVIETAGAGTDTIFSYLDAYVLAANAETLALAGSARTAIGNAGNNSLVGNNLNNVMNGEGGDDVLIGGGGIDQFWHLSGGGNDRITDFVVANETIVLSQSQFANFAAVQAAMTQSGSNVVIRFNANQSLTIENVTVAALTAGNFAFYAGSAGAPAEPASAKDVPLVLVAEDHFVSGFDDLLDLAGVDVPSSSQSALTLPTLSDPLTDQSVAPGGTAGEPASGKDVPLVLVQDDHFVSGFDGLVDLPVSDISSWSRSELTLPAFVDPLLALPFGVDPHFDQSIGSTVRLDHDYGGLW